jgi:hypothetical protein
LPLDTHVLVKELTTVGFTEPQAEALTRTVSQLASKDDLADLLATMKADLAHAVERLEYNLAQAVERLEHQIELQRRDLTIWLGSMIVAATAILLAARFFGHG